jgi:hypothetical protein
LEKTERPLFIRAEARTLSVDPSSNALKTEQTDPNNAREMTDKCEPSLEQPLRLIVVPIAAHSKTEQHPPTLATSHTLQELPKRTAMRTDKEEPS